MHTLVLRALALELFLLSGLASAQSIVDRTLIVATDTSATTGTLARVGSVAPWNAFPNAAPSTHASIVRTYGGLLYVLGTETRTLTIRTLPKLKLVAQYSLPQVLAPRDVVMVGPRMALISDHDSAHLWWLDTQTGVLTAGQDLGMYSDGDGLPDVARMEVRGNDVYVQMQRYDRNTMVEHGAKLAVLAPGFSPIPPVILLQDIDLQGLRPNYRMQFDKNGTKLRVSCPGVDGDWGGFAPTGIEEVDLNTGTSLGFVLTEFQCGADLGPFVMVDDDKGLAIAHTSIVASTHLRSFRRGVGQLAELHVSIAGRVDTIDLDPRSGQVFYPVPQAGAGAGAVLVFDGRTDQQLSPLIGVGGTPVDMILAP